MIYQKEASLLPFDIYWICARRTHDKMEVKKVLLKFYAIGFAVLEEKCQKRNSLGRSFLKYGAKDTF